MSVAFTVCPSCGTPASTEVPTRTGFAVGPNGGVLITRRVPGKKDHWITAEYWPPSDSSDEYRLVEPLVPLKLAAIALGLSPATIYFHVQSMSSAVKHGSRWFFKTEVLYNVDAASIEACRAASVATEHADAKQGRSYDPVVTSRVARDGTRVGVRALHEPSRGMWSASEAFDRSSMTSASDLDARVRAFLAKSFAC